MKENIMLLHDSTLTALNLAQALARQVNGHIATLPDIVQIRSLHETNTQVWDRWFSTHTTLYFGVYKDKKYIVVAHHLGPFKSPERLKKWSDTRDKRNDRAENGFAGSPKITQAEFNKLMRGRYGKVYPIPFDEYYLTFHTTLEGKYVPPSEIMSNPLLRVLLGEYGSAFIEKHQKLSFAYAQENNKEEDASMKILQVALRDVYGCEFYNPYDKEAYNKFPNEPAAFFVHISRLSYWGSDDLSISTDIYLSDDLGLVNYLVVQDPTQGIYELKFNPERDYEKYTVVNTEPVDEVLYLLAKGEEPQFTQYPKDGNSMNTGAIKHKVLSYEKIGEVTSFNTPTYGSPFLKYHLDEVIAIMPEGANAYMIIGDIDPAEIATVPVQFYKVEVDTANRILTSEEVMSNLSLLTKETELAAA